MPAAHIDHRVLLKLAADRMTAAIADSDALKRFPGEEDPSPPTTSCWVRLVALDIEEEFRSAGSAGSSALAPAQAAVVLALTVCAPEAATKADAFALENCCSRIRAAMAGVTLTDSGTTTTLELDEATVSADPAPDPGARIRSAAVMVRGLAWRLSDAVPPGGGGGGPFEVPVP